MKKLLIALPIILIAIQFIPLDLQNPAVEQGVDFFDVNPASPEIKNLVKASCYDCHSNETKYPYYFKIAPVNFWLKHHVNEGREHLNFSEWANYSQKRRTHKLEESSDEMSRNKMPLKSYIWFHSEADLTEAQKQQLIDFFNQAK